MNTSFDALVIGGGIMGLMSARELAISGLRVAVLEAGQCGREASWAGGGIISPLYPWRYPAAVTALANWSQRHYADLCQQLHTDTGIDPEYQRSGLLMLSVTDKETALQWIATGHHNARQLSPADCTLMQPDIVYRADGALLFPELSQVRNPRLMKALIADVQRRGVKLIEQTPLQELIFDGETAICARTASGDFHAAQFLFCAGAWTRQLLEPLRACVDVKPIRGQMLLFEAHTHRLRHIVLSDGRYLIPRRDGRILCGSTLEDVGFDKSTTEEARDSLLQSAFLMMPSLRDVPLEKHWAGLRPSAPEGIPYIGAIKRNVFVNAGHFRNGVVLAPAATRLVADLMLQREPVIEPAPYRLLCA